MLIEQQKKHKKQHVKYNFLITSIYIYIYLVTLACAGGFLDVVKILLSNGANINLGQSTPLMEAAQEGHIELVQFLIENGTIIFVFFNL